jgi:hypothetical protein
MLPMGQKWLDVVQKKTSIEDGRNPRGGEEEDSGFILNRREVLEQRDSNDFLIDATGARTELMRPSRAPRGCVLCSCH